MAGDGEKVRGISGIILAGGESSRLRECLDGRPDKGMLPLGGKTMLETIGELFARLFAEVILVTDKELPLPAAGIRRTGDRIRRPAKNALAGIHAGLSAARNEYGLVAAGDMPFIREAVVRCLVNAMGDYDVVIPQVGNYLQPLLAVYSRDCLGLMEEQLQAGNYRIIDFFPQVRVRVVSEEELRPADPELVSFYNVNTPEEYRAAIRWFAAGGEGRGKSGQAD